MTIVQCIETITAWLNANVCNKIELKQPPDDNNVNKCEMVHPTAFAMYQPGKDKLPPGVKAPFPSVSVQLLEGKDEPGQTGKSQLRLQLSFTAWNPGTQKEEGAEQFTRNADGWKDVWGFVEKALREIENAEYLDGIRVIKDLGITYGQFNQDGQISDLYPYWAAWVIFTVEKGLANSAAYKDLL